MKYRFLDHLVVPRSRAVRFCTTVGLLRIHEASYNTSHIPTASPEIVSVIAILHNTHAEDS